MARPKRKLLQFGNEDSINNLLQEIYNESHNIRAQVVALMTKWNKNVNENGEIMAVGDKIAKLLVILSKNQDQKITILKHMKDSVYIDGKGGSDVSNSQTENLSAENKNELDAYVEKIKKQAKDSNN